MVMAGPNLETDAAPTPATAPPAAALSAIAWCLRALASGWQLHPAEREAVLTLLQVGIPGVPADDVDAAQKIIARPVRHRLANRIRDRASELSVRFIERAETLRNHSPPVAG